MKHLERLNDKQLLEYATSRMPLYRRVLARAKSFLSSMFGRQTATAARVLDVSGDDLPAGSMQKVTLSNFKAPNFKTLRKHVTALEESDAIDELQYIVDRLSKSSNSEIKAQAKRMYAMLEGMTTTFNQSLETLEGVAEKSIPSEVDAVFKSADKALTALLTEFTGSKVEPPVNVLVGSEEDHIDFIQYFDLSELVDSRMWVVVTCSLSAVGNEYVMSRHVTVLDRFQGPMHYDVGPATNDIAKSIKTLMAVEGIVVKTGAIEIKVDEKRITKALRRLSFVTDVKISPRAVNVWVKGNRKTFDQEKEIFAILSADTDIRTQMGRRNRLVSEFTEEKYWQLTMVARS